MKAEDKVIKYLSIVPEATTKEISKKIKISQCQVLKIIRLLALKNQVVKIGTYSYRLKSLS